MAGRKTSKVQQKPKAKPLSMAAKRTIFLDVLRQTANVSRAQRAAGFANSTAYRQRQANAAFRTDWDRAMTEAVDAIEESVMDRARDGVEKPVFFGGAQIGAVRHYSDALSMFILKSKRPEIYARTSVEMTATTPASEMTEAEAEAEFHRRLALLKDKP